ncbi:hypothetical protein PHAVU_009G041800 [Phaseolus vulgaris]|uniref:Uncharacterized protein n=1 Tax=Phaseolus vulgaris TaxID=3885 RepID=V7AUX2_PHAVU|nr:hypothetical protein PHAVU_009G041800g [Phaseolus vulgaris]ESW08393.1 hypothetical protein PHAVU_009G041800g [Phaseolus vulgaris]
MLYAYPLFCSLGVGFNMVFVSINSSPLSCPRFSKHLQQSHEFYSWMPPHLVVLFHLPAKSSSSSPTYVINIYITVSQVPDEHYMEANQHCTYMLLSFPFRFLNSTSSGDDGPTVHLFVFVPNFAYLKFLNSGTE